MINLKLKPKVLAQFLSERDPFKVCNFLLFLLFLIISYFKIFCFISLNLWLKILNHLNQK